VSQPNPPLPPYPPLPGFSPYGIVAGMTFGQILDRIFRLTRANIRPFLVIGIFPIFVGVAFEAVLFGGLFLAGAFHRPPIMEDPTAALWIAIPVFLIFIPIMFVVYGLYYGASTYAAVQADHDIKVNVGEAFRHAWSRLGRYIWLYVLRSLIIALPIAVIALVIGVGALLLGLMPLNGSDPNPAALFFLIPLGILFYIGAFVYAILMSLRFSLAFPACIHEDISAGQALKRSGKLTNGAKGRIFLVALVIYAISYAAAMIFYAVGGIMFAIGAIAVGGNPQAHLALTITLAVIGGIVILILIFLWAALLMAAYSIGFAVLYRDQCLRKDGLLPAPAL
jgi:hypothetical protein